MFALSTWKTVIKAHSRESKFLRPHFLRPLIWLQNLQPNRFIPRMLNKCKGWLVMGFFIALWLAQLEVLLTWDQTINFPGRISILTNQYYSSLLWMPKHVCLLHISGPKWESTCISLLQKHCLRRSVTMNSIYYDWNLNKTKYLAVLRYIKTWRTIYLYIKFYETQLSFEFLYLF